LSHVRYYLTNIRHAELRNRIYDHVLEPLKIQLLPRPTSRPSSTSITSWDKLIRKSLGLTQTCRQLREEFLPLHQQSTEIVIGSRFAQFYVNDAFADPTLATGVIGIELEPVSDVIPLLRLCETTPHLNVKFYGWGAHMVKAVTDVRGNKKWREAQLDCVPKIAYNIFSEPFAVVLKMQVCVQAVEDWMPWNSVARDAVRRRGGSFYHTPEFKVVDEWKKRLGLGAEVDMLRVDVRVVG
jgi:hypothetical protein